MSVQGGCTILHACDLARFTHAWQADVRKRPIADSYLNPSVFRCSELPFSDLTHHHRTQCLLMKQDRWSVATENRLGNLSPRMVGVEPSQ